MKQKSVDDDLPSTVRDIFFQYTRQSRKFFRKFSATSFSRIYRPPFPLFYCTIFLFWYRTRNILKERKLFYYSFETFKLWNLKIGSNLVSTLVCNYLQGTLFAFLVESDQVPQNESMSRSQSNKVNYTVKSNLLKRNYRVSNSLYKLNFDKRFIQRNII